MKKVFLSLSIACIACSLIVASCKKTTYPAYNAPQTPSSPSVATISLNQLFAPLRSTPQNLSVVAGRDTVIFGAQGTMLHFYANSFKSAGGGILTGPIIHLQLIEMYKPGDMIRNRAITMANGQILQSGGQITMTATLGNGEQVLANTYGVAFKQQGPSAQPMALFYGAPNSSDSVVTWTQGDTTNKGVIVHGTGIDTTGRDSTSSGTGTGSGTGIGSTTQYNWPTSPNNNYFYFDTCKSFGWANCDWFFNSDLLVLTTVSVVLPDTSFNASNTQLYVILPNIAKGGNSTNGYNSVLGSDRHNGSDSYYSSTNTIKLVNEERYQIVPTGYNYTLVVITNKNGTYYYYQQTGNIPTNGIVATATMAILSQADILAKLQAL